MVSRGGDGIEGVGGRARRVGVLHDAPLLDARSPRPEHGGQVFADEGDADAEAEELHDSGAARGRSDGRDLDELERHDDRASQSGSERAETAATNEECRREHGAAAKGKQQRQPGDGDVGENGTLELLDGRGVTLAAPA